MDGATYWQRRAQQQLIAAEQIAGQLEQRMQKAFHSAAKDIETQIYKLYGKYAADNGLSYAEAKKYLNRHELKEFQQDLDFYLEKARDPAYRKEYRAYLQALSTRARVSRLEEYQARLKIIAETLYTAEVVPDATATAKEVFTESYLRAGFDMSQFFGVALSFAMPSERLFRTITEYPWSGKSFSQKWQDNCHNFETVLNEVLTKGLVAGYSNQKMARELRDKTNAAYDRARRLVRTETNYIHNQATASLYDELGVEYYEYLATLDTRTSPMCSALDGKRFRYAERKYGVNYPPLHPWCRSTTVPIVYEDDDMGTRIARDADGKNIEVPASMKYAEWKQRLVNGALPGIPSGGKIKIDTGKVQGNLQELLKDCTTSADIGKFSQAYFQNKQGCRIKEIDFSGVYPDAAKAMALKLDELDNRFHSSLVSVKTKALGDDYGGACTVSRESVLRYLQSGDDTVLESHIVLNSDFLSSKEIIKADFQLNNRSPNNGVAHLAMVNEENMYISSLLHEYGHSVLSGAVNEFYLSNGGKNGIFMGARRLFRQYKGQLSAKKLEIQKVRDSFAGQPDGLRKGNEATQALWEEYNVLCISEYSYDSVGEFIAEAFCDYELSSTPKEYSKKLHDILEKSYGKKG